VSLREGLAVRILVAEDNPSTLQALRHHLEAWGHQVVPAQDGAAAWQLFRDEEFFMVISDWVMPGMDGLELVRHIRAHPRPSYAFIILLTVKSETADLVQGIEAGADDFIPKPFNPNELRARLLAGERIIRLQQALLHRNRELEAANARISSANQRLMEDRQVAANSQKAFLPTDLPKVPGFQFAWVFQPCEELAGDMFNVFRLDESHVALYLLDVSGHGVTAALLAVTLSRLLSPTLAKPSLLKERIQDSPGYRLVPPAEVARHLNQQFTSTTLNSQFFTLLYGILDLRTRDFRYVSAGHPGPLLLARDGTSNVLTGGPPAIGIFEAAVYREHAFTLQPGDRLYLYSDGLLETVNGSGQIFGEANLRQTLAQSRSRSLQDSLSALMKAAQDWRGEVALTDDISALAVEIGT
jgi:sigma-B regulation protein RsbU (phosphoserine phosphatase)